MKVQHTETINKIPEYAAVLKKRRERMGFKQSEIAAKMGLSAMGLSYLENGTRGCKVETLERWAEALGAEVWIDIKDK